MVSVPGQAFFCGPFELKLARTSLRAWSSCDNISGRCSFIVAVRSDNWVNNVMWLYTDYQVGCLPHTVDMLLYRSDIAHDSANAEKRGSVLKLQKAINNRIAFNLQLTTDSAKTHFDQANCQWGKCKEKKHQLSDPIVIIGLCRNSAKESLLSAQGWLEKYCNYSK